MTSRRFEEVRQILAESRLQGFLVTFLPNVRYLTGFSGSNAVALVRHDDIFLVTDARYKNQAFTEVTGARTIIARGNLLEAIARNHLVSKKDRIGFEAGSLSVSTYSRLKGFLKGITLVPTDSLVEQVRVRKDESEIEMIRQAIRITDKVFKKILTILRPGMRELEVAAEIGYWHRIYGADSDAFDPIVASGVRGAFPHGRATSKKLDRGEMVTIDMGCRVRGYHSDLTRTVSLGKPGRELKSMYRVVLEAHQKALETAAPSLMVRALDGVARSHIRRNGYGKFFPHSLGHGLGLEVHEKPLVSARGIDVLHENSVITIEPGIYVPGLGGVRIEDVVVLRRGENEILTKAPKQLIVL
jgi:Xaa-Pro aminopeptidase